MEDGQEVLSRPTSKKSKKIIAVIVECRMRCAALIIFITVISAQSHLHKPAYYKARLFHIMFTEKRGRRFLCL